MLHALTDPWSQGFVQRAFFELALLGVVGGALGCWVLFYELSYGAESLAHALFPGLVLAALAGGPLVLGAGGGARAVVYGLVTAGFQRVSPSCPVNASSACRPSLPCMSTVAMSAVLS